MQPLSKPNRSLKTPDLVSKKDNSCYNQPAGLNFQNQISGKPILGDSSLGRSPRREIRILSIWDLRFGRRNKMNHPLSSIIMCVFTLPLSCLWIFEYGENEENIRINEKGWEACLLPMTFPRIPVCCIAPKPPTLPGTTPANSSVAANFDFSHPGCHWLIWNDTGGPVSNSCH